MQKIRTDKFEVSVFKEPILLVEMFEGQSIDDEDAVKMRAALIELSGKDGKYAVLLDATKPFHTSPEARALIADKEFSKDLLATALVVTSMANRLVGNFFIRFNKPHIPTRLFSSIQEASEWLDEKIKK